MAPSAKTFASDDSVLDPAIKSHIATLYEAVDNKDLQFWGSHFTEDAELKKGTSNVRGRENLVALVTKSWEGVKSRDHTVYAVFPFGHNAEEAMLHGRSNNVSSDDKPTTFTWAARMHFRRSPDGKVLIDKYTIIPDPHPSTL